MYDLPTRAHNPPVRLLTRFHDLHPDAAPEYILPVPGWEMWVMAVTNTTREVCLQAPDLHSKVRFSWRSACTRRTVLRRPLPRWARYAAGVVVALREAGLDVPGASVVVVGDEVPGPRYDYALGVAVAALWHDMHQRPCDEHALSDIVEKVYREYVGQPQPGAAR